MSLPSISYADFRRKLAESDPWTAAFARIEEGQKLSAKGTTYTVLWKHMEPEWVQLEYKLNKARARRMVRKGDPLLLELK